MQTEQNTNSSDHGQQPVKKSMFMTKKERQEIKLRREAEKQEQDKKFINACLQSKKLYEEIGEVATTSTEKKPEPIVSKKKKPKQKKVLSDEQSDRSRSRSRDKEKKQKKTKEPKQLTEEQLQMIQQDERKRIKMDYLGLNMVKRREMRHSDKFKNVFNFEWADKDDTMQYASSIHMNKQEASLLFGKGLRAGIDIAQQKNQGQGQHTKVEPYRNKYDKIMQSWQTKKYSEMTERDWRIFREDNDIITKGGRVPYPIRSWEQAHLDIRLEDAIKRMGFKTPKPIQKQGITIGLVKKDMIALAPTGEGKTLAYLIPLISFISGLPPITSETSSKGPYALILLPARQLAEQISGEFEKLTLGLGCRSETVVGGKKIQFQGLNLQQGCQVLIGTPGRIRDLLEKHYVVLNQCCWVVIDQADKMIDMDMEPDVTFILDSIGSQLKSEDEQLAQQQQQQLQRGERMYRVTHLFSATMPMAIEKLAKKYLRSYCYISIGEPGSGKKDIQHHIQLIDESHKKHLLGKIIKDLKAPIIVFVNQKRSCQVLRGVLSKWGRTAIEYHGGKSQDQREQAIEHFKQGRYQILLATDLAGRGLHVEGVTAVINFDAPKSINDYIHRTGRTGRAGNKGTAYTFLTAADQGLFYDLKQFLSRNNQQIPAELDNHPASKIKPGTIADIVPRRKQVLYAQ